MNKKETIREKIKSLEEEHIVYNGFSIDECGYDNCANRTARAKLRKKLKAKKETKK